MIELITIPLMALAAILIVGIIVESLEKGLSNLSSKEYILFLTAGLILLIVIALG